jgi:hypothetical protein
LMWNNSKFDILLFLIIIPFQFVFFKTNNIFFDKTRSTFQNTRPSVVSTRRVWFKYARVWFPHSWVWFRHAQVWFQHARQQQFLCFFTLVDLMWNNSKFDILLFLFIIPFQCVISLLENWNRTKKITFFIIFYNFL